MSEMVLASAIRFKVGKTETRKEAFDLIVNLFGKPPEETYEFDGVVESFEYDPEKNDGFTAQIIEDNLYVDYMLKERDPCDGLDINLTKKFLDEIVGKFMHKFDMAPDWKVKILYYYNGSCAGLCEVA